MPQWRDLESQQRVVRRLRAAIDAGKLHHALLFSGPAGCGMRQVALTVAAALNCEASPSDPCGQCTACAKIEAGIHPDVVTLMPEGAAQIIPIETVRAQVVTQVGFPPHEAKVRVILIDEAAALAPASANALLKTLEEPPARTMFILATVAAEQLLPTIRSRCQRIVFAATDATAAMAATNSDGGGSAGAPVAAPVVALAEELAQCASGDREFVTDLTTRMLEDKTVTAAILLGAAARLHARAVSQLASAPVNQARQYGAAAQCLLGWHRALTAHNANGALALDAMISELRAVRPSLGDRS